MSKRFVRMAQEEDFQFVSDLMQMALSPYYGGDHRAHAARIFRTHIEGGMDKVGHFSTQQLMFILEEDGTKLGVINIVGKRQGTWKISPLIVASEFQNVRGCGSELLTYAERYAREQGARQMYCTVAEKNRSAMAFFRRKGYVMAGHSESHYKIGINEVMLYKPFYSAEQMMRFDQVNISVVPFEDKYGKAVAKLILDSDLPKQFNGVDEHWVEALFAGYARRHIGEVNTKYKLIFVAMDRSGEIIGVAGATPKKGEPIKIMPCVAKNSLAFATLITDLPQHLRAYGHKLYIHLVPSVEETIIFQRLGWSLDAVMPAAYNDHYCTQQWGFSFKGQDMRNMRVKGRFFDQIMNNQKKLEVRVGYENIRGIRIGENIRLMSRVSSGVIRVRAVRNYLNFEAMLRSERSDWIVPGQSSTQVLCQLREIYSPEKERLGVVVLEIEPVK